MNFNFKGLYKARVYEDGALVSETSLEPKNNLILNSFFTDLAYRSVTTDMFRTYCAVGTGTSEPVATQTVLDNYVAKSPLTVIGANSSGKSPTENKSVAYGNWIYDFGVGGAVGNLAEVGVNLSGTTFPNILIHTRSRFKNDQGQNTTITVTASQQLVVDFTLVMEASLDDVVQVVNISGVNYTFTGRWASYPSIRYILEAPHAANTYYGAGSDIGPAGTALVGNTQTGGPGDRVRSNKPPTHNEITVTWSISAGNTASGLVDRIKIDGNSSSMKYKISPAIPKNNQKSLSLVFNQSFGRV